MARVARMARVTRVMDGSGDSGEEVPKPKPKKVKGKITGYKLYSDSVREALKELHPHLSIQKITGVIGKDWRKLPEKDQERWVAEATERMATD